MKWPAPESRVQIDSQSTNWHQTDRTVSARPRPSPRANDLPDLQLPCLFNVAQKECTACPVQCSCALVKQSHVKAWPCIYILTLVCQRSDVVASTGTDCPCEAVTRQRSAGSTGTAKNSQKPPAAAASSLRPFKPQRSRRLGAQPRQQPG